VVSGFCTHVVSEFCTYVVVVVTRISSDVEQWLNRILCCRLVRHHSCGLVKHDIVGGMRLPGADPGIEVRGGATLFKVGGLGAALRSSVDPKRSPEGAGGEAQGSS
jgi:hypothetical protein